MVCGGMRSMNTNSLACHIQAIGPGPNSPGTSSPVWRCDLGKLYPPCIQPGEMWHKGLRVLYHHRTSLTPHLYPLPHSSTPLFSCLLLMSPCALSRQHGKTLNAQHPDPPTCPGPFSLQPPDISAIAVGRALRPETPFFTTYWPASPKTKK